MFHEYCASDSQEHALEQCLLFDWTRLYYIIFPNQGCISRHTLRGQGFVKGEELCLNAYLVG